MLALVALSCKGGDDRPVAVAGSGNAAVPPSVIAPQSRPYRERADVASGAVRLVVSLDGDAHVDSTALPPSDAHAACGPARVDERGSRNGARLPDVVVWLPDVREGKALSLEGRHDLTIEHCRLEPRVQVATVGGTVNLRAMDPVAHRTRFVRYGDGARLAEIATTEPMSVVPDEDVLRKPGQIEVTCDAHPWARAWLFAFDHPYAAVTAQDGTARLDRVPPGTWRVIAWHERYGVIEGTATVVAGAEVEVKIDLKAR